MVTFADLLFNFNDPSVGGTQLRFNHTPSEGRNVLHWNGGGGPISGFGNANGLAGVTFGSSTAAPEPTSITLVLTAGLGLVGVAVRRRRAA